MPAQAGESFDPQTERKVAVAVQSGTIDTEAILADEKKVDMVNEFQLLDPDESQFMTILRKLPSSPGRATKVQWLEDQYFPRQSAVTAAGYIDGTTSIAIPVTTSTGVYFRAGDLVRNGRTGEMFEVTSVSADNVTCNRNIGGAGHAAGVSADDLLIVSNSAAQGADVGTMKVTTRVLGYNYEQIVRQPFGFTNTDVEIDTYGPGDPMNEIAKKSVEHQRALEAACWFGARAFTSASPSSKGYMGGLLEFIATNKSTSIGTLTLAILNTKLAAIYQHGSRNKVIFSAPVPAAALSGLLANNWVRSTPDERVYGAKVDAFVTGAYGDRVPVIVKREWGTFSSASNQYGSMMVVVDLDYIKRRPLKNRDTSLLRNRQGPGVDSVIHEYLTEQSLQVAVEQAHGLLLGITG